MKNLKLTTAKESVTFDELHSRILDEPAIN